MTPNLAIVAEFLIACGLITAGLVVIGFPLKAFVLDRPEARSPVPSLVAGLAVVQLIGWYWLKAGSDGLRTPVLALLVLGAIGSVVALIRRGVPRPRREDLPAWVAAAGVAVVFFVVFASVFSLPFHTTSSLGNNDAASYAIVGQFMVDHGFDDPGQVLKLGMTAENDAFGSTVLLGAASAATGIDVWKLTTPLMFILVVLGGATLARLLSELFPDAPVQSGLAAVAACAGFLFFYIVGMYFLGQIMAMAMTPILAVAALRAAKSADVRSAAWLAASVAIVVLTFISHYIHMLAPVLLLVGAGALVASGRDFRRALPRIAGVLGAGLVVAMLLMPELIYQGVIRTRELGSVVAGFPLPGFVPSELAGALEGTMPATGAGDDAASAMLLAGFGAALLALRRHHRRAALFAGATVTLILVSYVAVYFNEGGGPSYRQWKFITFFQPLFAALIFMSVCVALTDRAVAHRVRAAVPASCVALGALAAVILATSGFANTPTRPPFEPAPAGDHTFTYADPELSNLGVNPALAQPGPLNVDVADWWDTMWAIYFLRDRPLSPQSLSYFAVRPPVVAPTLAPRSVGLTVPGGQVVNKRFQLEPPFNGPTSATAEGLAATVAPTARSVVVPEGGPIRLAVAVRNTGSAAWLASGATAGAVNLGAQLQTASGRELQHDFHRQAVAPARERPLPPGSAAEVHFEAPAPPPGRYRLRLQMVSENVRWFGSWAPVDVTVERAR